jgi:polyferredoxin
MFKISTWKLATQIVCFGLIVYLGYFGIRMIEWNKIALVLPTLSCYYTDHRIAQCFLRALQEGLSGGWKVAYTTLIPPIALMIVFGVLFGRSWCSWVCPLGFVQDLFIRVRKFFGLGHYDLSDNLKLASVAGRWFFVIALVVLAMGIGIPHFFMREYQYDLVTPFCQVCPGKQIFPFFEGRFKEMLVVDTISTLSTVMSWLAISFFAFYLITTSFIRRLWCRLCPMGAILGLFNRFSFLSLRKEGKRCTKCGICARSCPVQVKEVYEEKEKEKIDPSDCILCFRCVEMCPEKDALKIGFLKYPLIKSTYKRFLKSSDVKVKNCKRKIPSEQKQ